ncbi:unnamed protein product, partial [Ectocarpus fasciculatus]
MDEEVLDMEIIRSLRQQAPTGEDITALKEFDGDHTKLGKVERFFKETMKIPRYAPRLDCMIFKGGFERDVRDLTETLDIVSNSCTQVTSMRLWLLLLLLLL